MPTYKKKYKIINHEPSPRQSDKNRYCTVDHPLTHRLQKKIEFKCPKYELYILQIIKQACNLRQQVWCTNKYNILMIVIFCAH